MNRLKSSNLPSGYLTDLLKNIRRSGTGYLGCYQNSTLQSAFQPIYSLAHKRVVGYEGLVRGTDSKNRPVAPADLFASDGADDSLVFLDRLCRALHIKNFASLNDSLNWLFVNITPRIIFQGQSFGSFFKDLLSVCQFPAHRVVVEIVESPISHGELLVDTIDYYRDIGCLIAIDDFGAGHSNFERIWSLSPEIVKLDRSMIQNATINHKIRRLLPEIVSLLHQAESLVLIEGIETEEQAMIAMESDVDFVQGYYFAKPSVVYDSDTQFFPNFDVLFNLLKACSTKYEKQLETILRRFDDQIQQAIYAIQQGRSFKDSCRPLMMDKTTIRCYQLMPNGIQIGQTVVSELFSSEEDQRFKPIQNAESADWFRRHYLRNAVSHPQQLQITQPYLSITGAHMCITLSMMFATKAGNRVFCCDISWP